MGEQHDPSVPGVRDGDAPLAIDGDVTRTGQRSDGRVLTVPGACLQQTEVREEAARRGVERDERHLVVVAGLPRLIGGLEQRRRDAARRLDPHARHEDPDLLRGDATDPEGVRVRRRDERARLGVRGRERGEQSEEQTERGSETSRCESSG